MKNKTLQDYSEQEETLLASGDLEAMKAFIEECYRQGLAYFERGSFQEAAEFFQYVSELDREYPDIYYHMGIAFYESNNNRQAYIAFKNAIKFDSHNKEIINLMKNVQMNLGIEVTEEETDFQRITKNLPQFSLGEGTFLFGQAILEAIQNQETRTQNHEVRIQKTEHKLQVTGVDDSYNISIEVNSLDPQSRIYYNRLYSVLESTLDACRLVGNGLTAAQTTDTMNPHVQVLKKVLFCGLCGIITHIPWVGIGATIFHEYVDDMWDISADKAETEKMKKIASIVTTKLSSINAREVAAGTLALNFVKLRSEEILTINKTDEQNNSKIKNIFNLFIKKLSISNTPKITVIGIKEDDESITKLALLDAALIIKYLYDNHERILASSNSFIQEINNTIILKELVKLQSGIEQNQFMALQYDLYNQIECKISPVNIKAIRDKAAIGQWEDTSCGYGWFTYIKSGINTLLQGAYIKERLKLSEEQIEL